MSGVSAFLDGSLLGAHSKTRCVGEVRSIRRWIVLLSALFLVSCRPQPPVFPGETEKGDVLGPSSAPTDSIQIDVYLDATSSMSGFAMVPDNQFGTFINELQSALHTSWKASNMQFFKFGTNIRRISESELRRAGTSEEFYREQGIFEETNIDLVINRTSRDRISLVITDLFQTDGDVLAVVDKLRDRCFGQKIDLALLAITSEYDGMIYDARVPPFPYASKREDPATYRPFYAIIFGNGTNIERLFAVLKNSGVKEIVRDDHFLVISSRTAVQDFDVDVTNPDKKVISIQPRRRNKEPLTITGMIRDSRKAVPLLVSVRMKRGHYPEVAGVEISVDKLSVSRAEKKPAEQKNVGDFSIDEIKVDEDEISARLQLSDPPKEAAYSYALRFKLPKLDAFTVPAWVDELSSENPTAAKDGNKTLNLHRFVRDLLRAAAAANDYQVAKVYLHLRTR